MIERLVLLALCLALSATPVVAQKTSEDATSALLLERAGDCRKVLTNSECHHFIDDERARTEFKIRCTAGWGDRKKCEHAREQFDKFLQEFYRSKR
ncbi:hypothetical protein HY414_00955 [Candidatus Kaiserbacteria bacterium]|nr:hypothetical protein [Candidatus Kaiserbacteria bacterium]